MREVVLVAFGTIGRNTDAGSACQRRYLALTDAAYTGSPNPEHQFSSEHPRLGCLTLRRPNVRNCIAMKNFFIKITARYLPIPVDADTFLLG
jgi:hypothetical protein